MFADVLLNHPYARKREKFIYEIPKDLNLQIGSAVVVPFQRSKKVGIILGVHKDRPEFDTKVIEQGLSDIFLKDWQIELADWMSEYYFCSKYDAIRLMLPKNIWRLPKRENHRKLLESNKESVQKRGAKQTNHELTKAQKLIVEACLEEKPKISLLHGVTGSGKTEVYKKLISHAVDSGKQALLLVPEISLTPQLVKVFEGCFPDLAVIHSRLSEGKRAESWKNIAAGKVSLIIGSRSALFSPFQNLGTIILDEEHEWSYKQDQSPRYHARDVALKIGEILKIPVLLGSATPSLESMWHAFQGDYKLFTLTERILGTPLPKVQIVDLREELRAQNFSIFSTLLEQKIRSNLQKREQTVLFLNRRGSASSTVCRDCGKAALCKNCETPLTFHAKNFQRPCLICHHCGLMEKMLTTCPNCKSPRIKQFGIGTERVESELKKLFPLAKIRRADRDTMGKKESFKKLHDDLHSGEVDILIGTQMIGKGWDLPRVSLVGVILADLGLHIPDFRTSERIFELLTQVAGRAGRRQIQGEVIIQSYNPEHLAIQMSQTHNFLGFYEQEICTRKEAALPPFGKIVKLMFLHQNPKTCEQSAQALRSKLLSASEAEAGDHEKAHRVYAAPALFARINKKTQWNILVLGPNPNQLIKKLSQKDLEGWRVDVDPQVCV